MSEHTVARESLRSAIDAVELEKKTVEAEAKPKPKGMFKPTIDPNFEVPEATKVLLKTIDTMAKEEAPQNILIVGPQGCGKTDLCVWSAAYLDRDAIMVNCPLIRETKDWLGWRSVKAGTLGWEKSSIIESIERGGAVIILDEFNRLHSSLHNAIYPLLDHRRETYIEELGQTVKVGPGTIFLGTMNVGISHVGTYALDSSLEDRWGIRIDFDFLKPDREVDVLVRKTGIEPDVAQKLVQFATDVRRRASDPVSNLGRAISTRQLIMSAKLIKRMRGTAGIKISSVLEYTIVPFFSKEGGTDSPQAQVLQFIQGIFADMV